MRFILLLAVVFLVWVDHVAAQTGPFARAASSVTADSAASIALSAVQRLTSSPFDTLEVLAADTLVILTPPPPFPSADTLEGMMASHDTFVVRVLRTDYAGGFRENNRARVENARGELRQRGALYRKESNIVDALLNAERGRLQAGTIRQVEQLIAVADHRSQDLERIAQRLPSLALRNFLPTRVPEEAHCYWSDSSSRWQFVAGITGTLSPGDMGTVNVDLVETALYPLWITVSTAISASETGQLDPESFFTNGGNGSVSAALPIMYMGTKVGCGRSQSTAMPLTRGSLSLHVVGRSRLASRFPGVGQVDAAAVHGEVGGDAIFLFATTNRDLSGSVTFRRAVMRELSGNAFELLGMQDRSEVTFGYWMGSITIRDLVTVGSILGFRGPEVLRDRFDYTVSVAVSLRSRLGEQ